MTKRRSSGHDQPAPASRPEFLRRARATVRSLARGAEKPDGRLEVARGRTVTQVARSLVGSYITSLDMAGASVTLLRVDDELLKLWDAPVRTPALRWGI